jgi:hypothetical protein
MVGAPLAVLRSLTASGIGAVSAVATSFGSGRQTREVQLTDEEYECALALIETMPSVRQQVGRLVWAITSALTDGAETDAVVGAFRHGISTIASTIMSEADPAALPGAGKGAVTQRLLLLDALETNLARECRLRLLTRFQTPDDEAFVDKGTCVNPASLGCTVPTARQGKLAWLRAVLLLRSVPDAQSPRECTALIVAVVASIFTGLPPAESTAESLIPALVYLLLLAAPANLPATLALVTALRRPSALDGEEGYYLTSVDCAVRFILAESFTRDPTAPPPDSPDGHVLAHALALDACDVSGVDLDIVDFIM